MKQKVLIIIGCLMALTLLITNGYADRYGGYYKVTITNMTSNQTFTPTIVLNHKKGVSLFTPGSPASKSLGILAESGNTEPLSTMMAGNPRVAEIATSEGLLMPGDSTVVKLERTGGFRHISLAAMLIPTNDGFFALNGVKAPRGHRSVMYVSPAYDAGTEINDELCANIPGPVCDGDALSVEDGEGYVHIHPGIHGIGSLLDNIYDWRNPVARIVIERVGSYHDDDKEEDD